ncbi:hypothetical protein [Cylindrospermum sp. FACHB-282]|uniref:hypothetical protein n=1 Tax=Cylindrospermum sp. FACHB-282 TaxID=2692794 RepID=UPI00168A029A|nr:hypothetical protein [Cylindrospermum sp. FACHB-282]MBD2384093.1 hypothetical protein [Cylindrospermum sp. FACHB-282]
MGYVSYNEDIQERSDEVLNSQVNTSVEKTGISLPKDTRIENLKKHNNFLNDVNETLRQENKNLRIQNEILLGRIEELKKPYETILEKINNAANRRISLEKIKWQKSVSKAAIDKLNFTIDKLKVARDKFEYSSKRNLDLKKYWQKEAEKLRQKRLGVIGLRKTVERLNQEIKNLKEELENLRNK